MNKVLHTTLCKAKKKYQAHWGQFVKRKQDANSKKADYIDDEQMKIVTCLKCKESIIEMFMHEHVCKFNYVECNICQRVVMVYASEDTQLADHMKAHELQQEEQRLPVNRLDSLLQ